MLIKFEKVMKLATAQGAKYPVTKKWFLKNYPDFTLASAYDETMKAVELELLQLEADDCEEETVDDVA